MQYIVKDNIPVLDDAVMLSEQEKKIVFWKWEDGHLFGIYNNNWLVTPYHSLYVVKNIDEDIKNAMYSFNKN